jgi:hypothetical protein
MAPKRPKRPKDFSQAAKLVVDIVTGQAEEDARDRVCAERRSQGRQSASIGAQSRAKAGHSQASRKKTLEVAKSADRGT